MDAIFVKSSSTTGIGGENIDVSNPPAIASHIPDVISTLAVELDKTKLDRSMNETLLEFRNAANYIAAAMIFLKDNVFLERDLKPEDIKTTLLGHWGTCPGLNLVQSHLNLLIRDNDLDMIFIVGPGHGAPAILASLWIEGSLQKFYPKYSRNRNGLHNLISGFSKPGGLPSHVNAETPGAIHEGGELGYALSVAFGAVMDKPDLIAACVVGDGEAETGPTATAWHAYKYIDPAESGAVLPIVHVNGFKISERTIYGCMDNKEIVALFTGYGYQTRIVEDLEDIDADMVVSMNWALAEIRDIQQAARSGKPIMKPRWPVIILRTPKGWSGPKIVKGEIVEGSFRAHQVPLPEAKTDAQELKDLQSWLLSYKPRDLFKEDGSPTKKVLSILPKKHEDRLGQRKITYDSYEPLKLPKWQDYSVQPKTLASCMSTIGEYLDQVVVDNPKAMRIFSPDELVSNKLDAVFRHTGRNFQWDQYSNTKGGRVIEILSEHTCQGFLQGYTLTGRVGLFPSYESFLAIISTMMGQYCKFVKMGLETGWRQRTGSLNYITTSTWTHQNSNGYSHQSLQFLGSVLYLKAATARVYFPPDANTFLSTFAHCLNSQRYVNLMVGSKVPQAVFLSAKEAESHCRAGASVWKFASVDEGLNPDVVLVGIGAELMFEVVAAAALLRKMAPYLRVRVINVTDLMILELEGKHPHSLSHDDFDALFTSDRVIHFNFHGYAVQLQGLLFGRPKLDRVTIESYKEEGTTTTPFDMLLLNNCSRFDVAAAAVKGAAKRNEKVKLEMTTLVGELKHKMSQCREYIYAEGSDMPELSEIPNFESI